MPLLTLEVETRKKIIFDQMSPRQQKVVLRKGYERWDPFEEPNDPIDLRKGKMKATATELAKAFLVTCSQEAYSNQFGQGVWEICLGLVNDDEKVRGMYEFAVWHAQQLKARDLKRNSLEVRPQAEGE
jgi:hypothetical protein